MEKDAIAAKRGARSIPVIVDLLGRVAAVISRTDGVTYRCCRPNALASWYEAAGPPRRRGGKFAPQILIPTCSSSGDEAHTGEASHGYHRNRSPQARESSVHPRRRWKRH